MKIIIAPESLSVSFEGEYYDIQAKTATEVPDGLADMLIADGQAKEVAESEVSQMSDHLAEEHDETQEVLGDVLKSNLAGKLIPHEFDEVLVEYVESGNGKGQISSAVYKKDGVAVAGVDLSYDTQNRITSIKRS